MIMNFFREERGATAIEYALIASLIGMVIIGALVTIGESLGTTFDDVAAGLS